MKHNRTYLAFAASALALLWLAGRGIVPEKNPVPGIDERLVLERDLKKPVWQEFARRKDVKFSITWFFATGGTQVQLPSNWNPNSNTIYCIGAGATGATGFLSGGPIYGPGGGGGAFVGAGTDLTGSAYTLGSPNQFISIQVGAGLDTIFDASNNWIIAKAANGQSGGAAGSCTGPASATITNGGAGGNQISGAPSGPTPGGGGAGGPHGAGNNGATGLSGSGAGGTADAGNAGRATQFNGNGCGDGGNGGNFGSPSTGFAGLNYGGGGGAGSFDATNGFTAGGAGAGGLIAVSFHGSQNAGSTFSGAGSLTAIGSEALPALWLISGTGSFTASASGLDADSALFSGTGSLQANAIFQGKWPGSANFFGSGFLSGTFLPLQLNATFTPSGSFQSNISYEYFAGNATLGGSGSLTAVALVYPNLNNSPSQTGWTPHDAASYAQGWNDLLPRGSAWSRDPTHVMQLVITGLSQIWGLNVDAEAATLLTTESDPRLTTILLSDWERNWGLPDPCLTPPSTIGERRKALVSKITELGGQSRAFFTAMAKSLGYTVSIREFSPFMCGVSRCGDTTYENVESGDSPFYPRWQIGPPENRYYWSVSIGQIKLTWFRASAGQAGVDPHLKIGVPDDLVCILRRYGPAHAFLVFDFAGFTGGGVTSPLQGTP